MCVCACVCVCVCACVCACVHIGMMCTLEEIREKNLWGVCVDVCVVWLCADVCVMLT